jgi:hypothetical protein
VLFRAPRTVNTDRATISLLHQGRYPIYRIEIDVIDLQKFYKILSENPYASSDLIAQSEAKYSFRNNRYLDRLNP